MSIIKLNNKLIKLGTKLITLTSVPTYPLLDYDGNVYTTVTIGTQEWTVENLKTTTYADGWPLSNITGNTVPNIFSSWTNTDWDTFLKTGLNILSAVEAPGTFGGAKTNLVSLNTGDKIIIYYNLKMNSGTKPTINLLDSAGAQWASYSMNEGEWYAEITIPIHTPDTWCIRFRSDNTGTNCSCNFSMSLTYDVGWQEVVWGAYCDYDNNPTSGATYGHLYNFAAAKNTHNIAYFKKNNVQQTGWRVPTRTDYTTLATYLGGNSVAGGILKETGFAHWNSPNTGALDTYGFKALGSGIRLSNGPFDYVGGYSLFWTSTQSSANGYNRQLDNSSTNFTDQTGVIQSGLSIRCVRDVV